MSDMGVSIRALPNAVGLLQEAYHNWWSSSTPENWEKLGKEVENVKKWANDLAEEFKASR